MHRLSGLSRDSGLGLVEAVVSIAVAALLVTALAATTLTATRGGLASRADSNASNVLNEQVEKLRSLDYSALSLRYTDTTIAGDAKVDRSGTPWRFAPTGEPLVVGTVGGVPHEVQDSRNNVTFVTRRYVT